MNTRTVGVVALFGLVVATHAARAEMSQERRDYILAHPHGWVELAVDDAAIPQVPSSDEEHPGQVRPAACSVHVNLGTETVVRAAAYPSGDTAPYHAKSGFRFPAPVGEARLRLSYSGCDVEGGKLATVEAEARILVAENRVTTVTFDGTRLVVAKPKENSK